MEKSLIKEIMTNCGFVAVVNNDIHIAYEDKSVGESKLIFSTWVDLTNDFTYHTSDGVITICIEPNNITNKSLILDVIKLANERQAYES